MEIDTRADTFKDTRADTFKQLKDIHMLKVSWGSTANWLSCFYRNDSQKKAVKYFADEQFIRKTFKRFHH